MRFHQQDSGPDVRVWMITVGGGDLLSAVTSTRTGLASPRTDRLTSLTRVRVTKDHQLSMRQTSEGGCNVNDIPLYPLLDLTLFKHRAFGSGIAVNGSIYAGFSGFLFAMTLACQCSR